MILTRLNVDYSLTVILTSPKAGNTLHRFFHKRFCTYWCDTFIASTESLGVNITTRNNHETQQEFVKLKPRKRPLCCCVFTVHFISPETHCC